MSNTASIFVSMGLQKLAESPKVDALRSYQQELEMRGIDNPEDSENFEVWDNAGILADKLETNPEVAISEEEESILEDALFHMQELTSAGLT